MGFIRRADSTPRSVSTSLRARKELSRHSWRWQRSGRSSVRYGRWHGFELLERRCLLSWGDDDFSGGTLDATVWSAFDQDQPYSNGSVALDGSGDLWVQLFSYDNGTIAQAYVTSAGTMGDTPWAYYTAANFTAAVTRESSLDLGYRFEMADENYAYLQFDATHGMRLKYGNQASANLGASLYQTKWYELKFVWDGTELRAWYRERGGSLWLGGTNNTGYTLYSSTTTYPQTVKIGQTDVEASASGTDVTMTLLVDYWRTTEPTVKGNLDYSPLVQNVQQIAVPGVSGPVYATTEDWVPIVAGDADTPFPRTFVMAREYGRGRVVAIGNDGIFSGVDRLDTGQFLENVVAWLRDGNEQDPFYTTGHSEIVNQALIAPFVTRGTSSRSTPPDV